MDARLIEPTPAPTAAERSSVRLLAGTNSKRTAAMQRPSTSRPARPVRTAIPARPRPDAVAAPAGPPARKRERADRPAAPAAAGPRPDPARVRAAAIRACLTSAFALLTVLALALSLTSGLTIWAGLVCGGLTGAVLVVGRRAVVAERRADSRKRAGADVADPARGRTDGRTQGASATLRQADDRPDRVGGSAAARQADRARAHSSGQAPGRRGARADVPLGGRETGSGRAASAAGLGLDADERDGRAASAPSEPDAGERDRSAAPSPEASAARRPGISGRVHSGRTVYHLPERLEIKPLEADETPAAPRRLTPARPTPAPLISDDAPAEVPAHKRIPMPPSAPAPTYTMMPGAPKWEPKALTALDYAQARESAARLTRRAAAEALAEGVETAASGEIKIPGRVVFAEDALDLDRAIAARRRAAGR
ncbi:MAG: hypothetical protein LBG60_06955 [Bifidobacteriaceae bacterium]|nr:hypothetical protein [Bifidobacteriaceae bacterium]